jgi:hypothetical protein
VINGALRPSKLLMVVHSKTAYKSAYPDLSAEEAHKDGRSEETNILQQASSKVFLHHLLARLSEC